ncbi:MAG: Hsp20/alpha crystallin family protein [Candidatus Pacebacteria bacterium]|nr:Hsp20/alpha crystallin family protein [Candidatus Paceibacterota bacterium]
MASDFFEKLSGSGKIEEETENIEPNVSKVEESPQEEGQLAVDVFQTDNEIIIQSTIAGVKSSDLDIMIQNDMVSIRGERKKEEEVDPSNYFYQECYWGPFSRSVVLPEEIKTDGVKAELKNGVLTLRLPKVQKTEATKIKVKEISE